MEEARTSWRQEAPAHDDGGISLPGGGHAARLSWATRPDGSEHLIQSPMGWTTTGITMEEVTAMAGIPPSTP